MVSHSGFLSEALPPQQMLKPQRSARASWWYQKSQSFTALSLEGDVTPYPQTVSFFSSICNSFS